MKLIKSFSVFSLLAVIGFVSQVVNAQTTSPTPPPTKEDEVIKVNSRLVVVPVSVTNASGDPVLGLKAENFRVKEEGKAQTIDNVGNAENVPLEIALLFDISASTDAMFKYEQETASKFLQDVMRAEDRATIFTVGQKGTMVQGRETAEKSITAIRAITPTREQTAFYDSVRIAAEYLQRNTPEGRRKVILLISDGEDTNSDGILKAIWEAERKIAANVQGEELKQLRVRARDTAKVVEQVKVLKALQNADAVLFSINPGGTSVQLNKMAMFGQENMQKFADETGGTAFVPSFQPIESTDSMQNSANLKKNTETLERIFRQIANELRAQYLIQYYSDAEYAAGRFVKLDVALTSTNGLKIRARQGYYPKN